MKVYIAKDSVGRIWHVPYSKVVEDYVEAVMQMDGVERDVALEHVLEQGEGAIDSWWYEQVLPYADIVMSYGELVVDISEEQRDSIILQLAKKGYMEGL